MGRRLCYLSIFVLVLLLSLTSCHRTEKIVGNGNKQTVARDMEAFQKVSLSGNYDVTLIGGMPQYVSLTTDSNLLNYLTTTVKNKTLEIGSQSNVILITKEPPFAQINMPNLQKVSIDGPGRLNASKISADTLVIQQNGSGRFTVTGNANKVVINIHGAGVVNASDLIAKQVDINLIGDGRASVHASDQLNVRLSGSGLVEFYGSPTKVTQNIAGSGRIIGISSNAQENPS